MARARARARAGARARARAGARLGAGARLVLDLELVLGWWRGFILGLALVRDALPLLGQQLGELAEACGVITSGMWRRGRRSAGRGEVEVEME
eukprot:scaffold7258_cov34-Phaeocystis_antarctica.AAC.1